MNFYDKWNRLEIGNINFVNGLKDHPHRFEFVNYVIENSISSILEIGPGELIEYEILSKKKNVDYSILDVSDVFLNNCMEKFPEVNAFKGSMCNASTIFNKKQFDLVYLSSVLEHSEDLEKTVENLAFIAKNFYIVLFRWNTSNNKIESVYHKSKGCYSSNFSLKHIINLFNNYGIINEYKIFDKSRNVKSFSAIEIPNYTKGSRLLFNGEFK